MRMIWFWRLWVRFCGVPSLPLVAEAAHFHHQPQPSLRPGRERVSAATRVADTPFLIPDIKSQQPKVNRLETSDALTSAIKVAIEEWREVSTVVGNVQSLATLKKAIAETSESKEPMVKDIFEVGGADGFLVTLIDDQKQPAGTLLVRTKGESAKVVGILPTARPAPVKKN